MTEYTTEDVVESLERIANQLNAIALLLYVKETRQELTTNQREEIEGWIDV